MNQAKGLVWTLSLHVRDCVGFCGLFGLFACSADPSAMQMRSFAVCASLSTRSSVDAHVHGMRRGACHVQRCLDTVLSVAVRLSEGSTQTSGYLSRLLRCQACVAGYTRSERSTPVRAARLLYISDVRTLCVWQ